MKVCVYGAGAIGGHLAAVLAAHGHTVTVIVRERTCDVIRRRGLTLLKGDRSVSGPLRAVSSSHEAGPQDLVVVTVKSTAVPALAGTFAPLLGQATPVMFALNGIPWWYAHRPHAPAQTAPDLALLDPGSAIAASLGLERVIGCVVFSANEVVEPGVVRNLSLDRNEWTIGELDGTVSPRAQAIATCLADAGLSAAAVPDIRRALWSKLIAAHLAVALVSTVEGKPQNVLRDPALQAQGRAAAAEGLAVARAYGIEPGVDLDALFPQRVLDSVHKPSMLQDFELGRALEIDGIVAVQKLAEAVAIETPQLDALIGTLVQKVADRDRAAAAKTTGR